MASSLVEQLQIEFDSINKHRENTRELDRIISSEISKASFIVAGLQADGYQKGWHEGYKEALKIVQQKMLELKLI
jgi:hypothetical protein